MSDPLDVIEVEKGHYYEVTFHTVSSDVGPAFIGTVLMRGIVRYDGETHTAFNGYEHLTVPKFRAVSGIPETFVADFTIVRDLGTQKDLVSKP